ncbi:unnamed protein product [Phytophthora fragariaefolia]|uniref:Unnamed protein product n=1 Tax=Phytophthora fragariaefolia TaxID=1490495 RepID=A0A9W6XRS0_9STRA|nr:unnamed protein product [Phytophthora fragariaefolia]
MKACMGRNDDTNPVPEECSIDTKTSDTLIEAAVKHIDAIRYLVENCGIDVDSNAGLIAFKEAAAKGSIDVVRYLAGHPGVDVRGRTSDGNTALMVAAGQGRIDVVRYLVGECGADVNDATISGTTALTRATEEGHNDVVQYIVKECEVSVNVKDSNWNSLIMMAARRGHIDVIRFLAGECGADVHAANRSGITALMMAAEGKHVTVIQYLVAERGANVNTTDDSGATVLMQAAARGHDGLVQYLVEECGADVNAVDDDGVSILMTAAVKGHANIVRYLAGDCGADVNGKDKRGATVLVKATAAKAIDVNRYLAKDCGVDVDARDEAGATLLMKTVADGHLDVCRCLAMECDDDIDATNACGATALMQVAENGDADLVRFLVTECGANVNATGDSGTGLMQTAAKGDIGVVRCLTGECRADLNASDNIGSTALMKATMYSHIDIVRHLIECGAIINATNEGGYTALRIASEQNDQRKIASRLFVRAVAQIWYISPSEIELIKFVETSNVGGEYRAKWIDADVAIKLFLPGTSFHATFADEVHMWHQLRHPNVIKLYGVCDMNPLPLQFFVCEYTSSGSLHDYVKLTPRKQQNVWPFLLQAALGLEYLHERGIIHCDVRCSNILIGSDGLSKLINFGQGGFTRRFGINVDSLRWQAPEVLVGEMSSCSSDVYSLGMCLLEAVTREVPWKNWNIDDIRDVKTRWNPGANGTESWEPLRPHNASACKLVWSMCSRDPARRISISRIVQELVRLTKHNSQTEQDLLSCIEEYRCGEIKAMWENVQTRVEKNSSHTSHRDSNELKKLYDCLYKSNHPIAVLEQFHTLLRDFLQMIIVPGDQARVLQLSATCATKLSNTAFFRRLRSLWSAFGESAEEAHEREERWEKQRKKQIEIFISEASKVYLVVEELKSQDEKLQFLASLKMEIAHPSVEYTPGQLGILTKAYKDVAAKLDSNALSKLSPEWFIPWYELIIDSNCTLGRGGFGVCVFRAKWLDTEVVVKQLIGHGEEIGNSSSFLSYTSIIPLTAAEKTAKWSETLAIFQREVDIWFRLSHPHVIRLFGACHIGRPFFVCEYATKGTLISYLRNHPSEIWAKLHDAALGVQYLHARGVVHGDLKGNNIVIGSDKKAKVTDFGLSLNIDNCKDLRISGAAHYVAPECFINEGAQPTFASDIYSLGMCIVEALRIVEAGDKIKLCMPWGTLDNMVVKYHVRHGNLPSPPKNCSDSEWELVQQMCVFEPDNRLKISAVVDRLEKMAQNRVAKHADDPPAGPVNLCSIPEAILEAQALLNQLKCKNRDESVLSMYFSMWGQLQSVYHQTNNQVDSVGRTVLYSLVAEAQDITKSLESMTSGVVSLFEATLRCCALTRRLGKFTDGYLIPPDKKGGVFDGHSNGKRHFIGTGNTPTKKQRQIEANTTQQL